MGVRRGGQGGRALQRHSKGSLEDGPREARWAAGIPWEPGGPAKRPEVRQVWSRASPTQHCQQSGPHHPLVYFCLQRMFWEPLPWGQGIAGVLLSRVQRLPLGGPLTDVLGSGAKGPKTLGIV